MFEIFETLRKAATYFQAQTAKSHRDTLIRDAKFLREEMSALVRESPLKDDQKRLILRRFEKTMGGHLKDTQWDVPDAPSEKSLFGKNQK